MFAAKAKSKLCRKVRPWIENTVYVSVITFGWITVLLKGISASQRKVSVSETSSGRIVNFTLLQTLHKWNGRTLFKRQHPDGVLFFWWQKFEIKRWLMGFFQTISFKYVNSKIFHKDVYFLLIGTGYISRQKWLKLTAWVVQTCVIYMLMFLLVYCDMPTQLMLTAMVGTRWVFTTQAETLQVVAYDLWLSQVY